MVEKFIGHYELWRKTRIKKIEREVANLKKFGLQDEGRDEKETTELTDELNKEYTDAINKIMSGCGEVRELLY